MTTDTVPIGTTSLRLLEECPLAHGDNEDRLCAWCGEPLRSRRSLRWCSSDCASAYARNHWWTRARKAALRRDGHACVRCGETKGALTVHHKRPCVGRHSEESCAHHVDGLETLCWPCHRAEHGHGVRGGETASHRPHKPETTGSTPVPATTAADIQGADD